MATIFNTGQRVRWNTEQEKNEDKEVIQQLIKEYGKGPFTVHRIIITRLIGAIKIGDLVVPRMENPYQHPQLLILKNRLGNTLKHKKIELLEGQDAELSGSWFMPIDG